MASQMSYNPSASNHFEPWTCQKELRYFVKVHFFDQSTTGSLSTISLGSARIFTAPQAPSAGFLLCNTLP